MQSRLKSGRNRRAGARLDVVILHSPGRFDIRLLMPITAADTHTRPAVTTQFTGDTKTSEESPPTATRSPGPARAAADGQVVHAETDPGEEDPHGGAEQDVETLVAVVEPPGRGDEACRGKGDESDEHEMHRGCCAARANRRALVKCIPLRGEVRQIWEPDGEFGAQPECQIGQSSEGH